MSLQAYATKTPSTLIYNENKKEIISVSEDNVVRPIASLTKIMTAIVAYEQDSDLTKTLNIGSNSRLPPGINTRADLFTALLVRSDNAVAEILAKHYPGGRSEFIKAMNSKAESLGLTNTKFVDPSGLGKGNVSTVTEVSSMIREISKYPVLLDTSILRQVEIKNKKYKVLLENTNKMLLASFEEIKFSKTGFTNPAGWSVGMILERHGQRFIVVILGAKNKEERYDIAKALITRYFADIEYQVDVEKQNKSIMQKMLDWIY